MRALDAHSHLGQVTDLPDNVLQLDLTNWLIN